MATAIFNVGPLAERPICDSDTGHQVWYAIDTGILSYCDGQHGWVDHVPASPTSNVKRYVAVLTRSDTSGGAPTADVKENTIGGFSWTRLGAGHYITDIPGQFPVGATVALTCGTMGGTIVTIFNTNDGRLEMFCMTSGDGTFTDGIVVRVPVDVSVYMG